MFLSFLFPIVFPYDVLIIFLHNYRGSGSQSEAVGGGGGGVISLSNQNVADVKLGS